MTVKSVTKLMNGPDLVCIRDDREIFYKGYLGMLAHSDEGRKTELLAMKVTDIRIETDIRAKDWKERKLEAPLFADQTPDYELKDLIIKLYMAIYVERVKS